MKHLAHFDVSLKKTLLFPVYVFWLAKILDSSIKQNGYLIWFAKINCFIFVAP